MRDEACSEGLTRLATSAVMRGRPENEILGWMLNNGIRPSAAIKALTQAKRQRQESGLKKLKLSLVCLFTLMFSTAILNMVDLLKF